jgi:hypothetical protein
MKLPHQDGGLHIYLPMLSRFNQALIGQQCLQLLN